MTNDRPKIFLDEQWRKEDWLFAAYLVFSALAFGVVGWVAWRLL